MGINQILKLPTHVKAGFGVDITIRDMLGGHENYDLLRKRGILYPVLVGF